MTRPTRGDDDAIWSIDDLELELRKLPGVRAAGFDETDDVLLVQLHVADATERTIRGDRSEQSVPVSASRIAARHSDRAVAVEVVRWRSAPLLAPQPAPLAASETTVSEPGATNLTATAVVIGESGEANRARLLAVLAFPETDELEVHLVLDGKRTIGRAPASKGIQGAVEATLDAVRDLGTAIHPRVSWARAIDEGDSRDQVVVAVALDGVDARSPLQYGLAAGTSPIDAAARATLDALNRRLSREALTG